MLKECVMICKECNAANAPVETGYCKKCLSKHIKEIEKLLRIILDGLHFVLSGDGSVDPKEYRLRRLNETLQYAEKLLDYEKEGLYAGELIKISELVDIIKTTREKIEAGTGTSGCQHVRRDVLLQTATLYQCGFKNFRWRNTALSCPKCKEREAVVFTREKIVDIVGKEFCENGKCSILLEPVV